MTLRGKYRHLTLHHERHLLNDTSPALLPGESRFLSYRLPSLPAGEYKISINQHVTAPGQPGAADADTARKSFEVIAPEWALSASADGGQAKGASNGDDDSAVVLSVFPAPGETAPSFRTLAHIVLRDPQLPWARLVSQKVPDSHANEIPWFALIVFTADELTLDEEHRNSYFKELTINETLGWDMPVGNVTSVRDTANGKDRLANFIPAPNQRDIDAETKASLITVPTGTFKKLFTNAKNVDQFDVSPYRFMTHVRNVAAAGTMSAAVANDDPDPRTNGTATFSMTVSHRLGPTDVNVPTPVLAHLVSLQGIDTKLVKVLDGKEHVLMTSLYSWTYTALPPNGPDVVSMLRYLGNKTQGLKVLRSGLTGQGVNGNEGGDKVVTDIMTRRQMDGYTLVRHRTVTGEQTAAMVRGPLTPTRVPHPLHKDVVFQSNFGTDLQILDPSLGLMDLSYASAWQLGKTLALADPSFTAALSRLRTKIHDDALEAARKDIFKRLRVGSKQSASGGNEQEHSVLTNLDSRSTYVPKNRIKADVADLVGALNNINFDVHATGTSFSTNRWNRRPQFKGGAGQDLFSLRSEHVFHQIGQHAQYVTDDNASTPDGGPYNYHTIPNNTDYALVQEWVLDKLHLAGIPAHYLLPDPSHLPPESLRLFHVDANWTDSMVDGALSLANHLADKPEEDFTRSSLKNTLNRYFKTPIVGDYVQQMPTYGFMLRSQLLIQFPDLAVSADSEMVKQQEDWANAKPKAPILVQRRLAADTMLVLFDQEPPSLSKLTLTLPAHQQTFIAAFQFSDTTDEVEMHYKRVYATGADAPLPVSDQAQRREPLGVPMAECKFSRSRIFDWEARTLKIQEYADLVHHNLKTFMPSGQYNTEKPTSAVMALQLNEPIYTLVITAALPEKPKTTSHGQQSLVLPDEDDLSRWNLLHDEPEMFRFYPPAFPAERYRPKSSLPEPTKTAIFQPTRLAVGPNDSKRHVNDWIVIPNRVDKKDNDEILSPPMMPAPPPVVAVPPLAFDIFPLGSRSASVPTNSRLPLDLIFDIRATSSLKYWDLRVTHYDLMIPIASYTDDSRKSPKPPALPDPDDELTHRALLRSDAPEGPAPSMLYNIRFNVVRQRWDVQNGWLYVTVLPRTKWGVGMQHFEEASFLLPVARVYPWKVPRGKKYPFEIRLRAYMRSPQDPRDKDDTQYDYVFVKYMDCPGA
ncbi:MAG: hypothetical protein Q9195_004528 [Heterodermia aff. obscurata]